MNIVLAIVIGALFGFVLQRVGAADPDKIIGMLGLRDLHLMKAIFTAIGLASALLFAGLAVGILSADHFSVKAAYVGVVVGGALLGIGWAIAGFCPGTGLVGLGAGRIDAVFFVIGGLAGAGLFTLMYAGLADTALMTSLFGGKTTLAENGKYDALLGGPWLAVGLGVAFIAIGSLLPARLLKS